MHVAGDRCLRFDYLREVKGREPAALLDQCVRIARAQESPKLHRVSEYRTEASDQRVEVSDTDDEAGTDVAPLLQTILDLREASREHYGIRIFCLHHANHCARHPRLRPDKGRQV